MCNKPLFSSCLFDLPLTPVSSPAWPSRVKYITRMFGSRVLKGRSIEFALSRGSDQGVENKYLIMCITHDPISARISQPNQQSTPSTYIHQHRFPISWRLSPSIETPTLGDPGKSSGNGFKMGNYCQIDWINMGICIMMHVFLTLSNSPQTQVPTAPAQWTGIERTVSAFLSTPFSDLGLRHIGKPNNAGRGLRNLPIT